jgi:type I restriction enzyme M protein
MTSTQQRAALQRQIWAIANDVRGAVDGWDFKQYVLGTLFYRFISENFANYIEAGDDSVNYAELPDSVITADIKDDAIKTKGYFIYQWPGAPLPQRSFSLPGQETAQDMHRAPC